MQCKLGFVHFMTAVQLLVHLAFDQVHAIERVSQCLLHMPQPALHFHTEPSAANKLRSSRSWAKFSRYCSSVFMASQQGQDTGIAHNEPVQMGSIEFESSSKVWQQRWPAASDVIADN